jgi:hypothetical protein
MAVQAKMVCGTKMPNPWNPEKSTLVNFYAVYDEEDVNKEWAESTPSANLGMIIENRAAADQFTQGKTYLLTFEEVE